MADAHVVLLSELMSEALRNKPIENRGDRIKAYWEAGISLAHIRDEDWREADEMARLEEISRRLTQ